MKTDAIDAVLRRSISKLTSTEDRELLRSAMVEVEVIRDASRQAPPPERVSLRKTVAGEFTRRAQQTVRRFLGEA